MSVCLWTYLTKTSRFYHFLYLLRSIDSIGLLIDKLLKKSPIIGLLCWIIQKKWVIHCESKKLLFCSLVLWHKKYRLLIALCIESTLDWYSTKCIQKYNNFYTSLASLICRSVQWLPIVSSINVNQMFKQRSDSTTVYSL